MPGTPAPSCDGPRTRRRGEALEEAIFDAVLAELDEHGFGRLTYEGVAARAGTGKSSLYRRWPAKYDLVLATLAAQMPSAELPPLPEGTLRDRMLHVLRHLADRICSPAGTVPAGLIAQVKEHPELFGRVKTLLLVGRRDLMRTFLETEIARGTARPESLRLDVLDVAPSLLMSRYFEHLDGIPDQILETMTDTVLLPLTQVRPA